MTPIDVWIASPSDVTGTETLLLDDERTRRDAIVFEKNRREYAVTRALVRDVLSRYRPVAPRDWRFSMNAHGRPEIDPPCGLRFNLSNHPTMVVCAVVEGAAIGVDVEPIARGPEILGMASTAFAPAELEALEALVEERRPDRALALWTLKEAYIKARGMGLSLPLSGFALRFEGERVRIAFDARIDDDPERWQFVVRDVDGHRIALAIEAPAPPEVRIRRWTART